MLLTVVSQPDGGGTIALDPSYSDNKYLANSTVTVTAQPSPGYVFAEWSGDVAGIADVTQSTVSVVMTKSKSITANFAESSLRYTVTTSAEPPVGGSVGVTPSQDNYTLNQIVSVTANCAEGYCFSHWAGDLNGSNPSADLRMNGNKCVTAVFNPVLSVRVEVGGGGTVEADPPATSGGYQVGTAVSLTARPALGYRFDRWSGDVAGISDVSQATVTVVVNEPRTVIANFVVSPPLILTSAVEDEGSGSLAFEPAQPPDGYLANQQVRVYALPAERYVFSHWTGDASGADPILELDMVRAQKVVAVFDPKVTVGADPLEGGDVEITPPQSSGGYLLGSQVTIEAKPAEGYRFIGWGGDVSGTENPIAITVDSPKTVTAMFVKESAFPWWWVPVAGAVALAILVGLPLGIALRRRRGSS